MSRLLIELFLVVLASIDTFLEETVSDINTPSFTPFSAIFTSRQKI
jgi:hypothetical protein